jgi:hypothetical protein
MTRKTKTKRGNENAEIQGKAVGTEMLLGIHIFRVWNKNNH